MNTKSVKVFIKKEKVNFFTISEEDVEAFIAEASSKYSISDKNINGVRTLNLTPKEVKTLKEAIELL